MTASYALVREVYLVRKNCGELCADCYIGMTIEKEACTVENLVVTFVSAESILSVVGRYNPPHMEIETLRRVSAISDKIKGTYCLKYDHNCAACGVREAIGYDTFCSYVKVAEYLMVAVLAEMEAKKSAKHSAINRG